MYRDVTGQARNQSSPTALLQAGCTGRGKWGHSFLKVPLPPWLGENGLALSVLLRDCLWLGRMGEVRLSEDRRNSFGAGRARAAQDGRIWYTPLLLPPRAPRVGVGGRE